MQIADDQIVRNLQRRMSHLISFSAILETAILVLSVATVSNSQMLEDPERMLDCRPRLYNYRVTQTDSVGRMCWDMVTVVSCLGRCDSIEVIIHFIL